MKPWWPPKDIQSGTKQCCRIAATVITFSSPEVFSIMLLLHTVLQLTRNLSFTCEHMCNIVFALRCLGGLLFFCRLGIYSMVLPDCPYGAVGWCADIELHLLPE